METLTTTLRRSSATLAALGLLFSTAAHATPATSNVSAGELAGMQMLYAVDNDQFDFNDAYTVDNSGSIAPGSFGRVAYYVELGPAGNTNWVWVSMDTFNANPTGLGVPRAGTGIVENGTRVSNLNVETDHPNVTPGIGLEGIIEFWASNYNPNGGGLFGSNDSLFDWKDSGGSSGGGHGSFQIFAFTNPTNTAAQTLFGITANGGSGIGDQPTGQPDSGLGPGTGTYAIRNLEIWVGPGAGDDTGATNEDTLLTVVDPGSTASLLANDVGSALSVTGFQSTSVHGASVTVAPNGTFSYDPTGSPALQGLGPGQTLDDTFTYTVRDGAAPAALGGVTAALELWLDASDIDADGSPDAIASGAAITNWRDKSGNGHDADVVTGDPSYVASGGGRPVVGFDGSDQISLGDDLRSHITNADGSYSLITVARYSGGQRARVISVDSGHNWLFGFHGGQTTRWYTDGWVHLDAPAIGGTDWVTHTGLLDAAPADPQGLFYRNGTLLTNTTSGNGNITGRGGNNNFNNYAPDRLALGGWNVSSEFSQCEVAEVILYDRLLSDSERLAVEGYLNDKYFGASATVTITVSGIDDPLVAENDDYCTDEDTVLIPTELSSLLDLNSLVTGDYSVTADGDTFDAHVDHDGTHGWLLVGRGRQGWAWTDAGLGTVDAVNDNLGTPAGFAPAYYRSAIINDLIAGAGVDLTDVEIRLKRAGDPAGTTYQEDRWRPTTQTTWDWVFPNPSQMAVEHEIVSGPFGTQGPHNANTHDEGGNNWQRVFTWAWGGHASQQGFSYGQQITNGTNSATSFLWENGNEQHAIPYTEVYIRVPSAPAALNLLANDSDPDNPIFVSAVNTTGTVGLVTVPTGFPAGNGSFNYDPNGMFESLNVGDMATDTFEYTVTTIAPASARFVRVENNGTGTRRMDIGEIEVFAPGVTPAVDNAGGGGALNPSTDLATTANGASLHSKGATSGFSQPHGGDDDPRLIDGAETTAGNTWSSNGVGNFVVIDLGSTQAVGSVRVHQRNDGCCQDRLRDFTVSLLADSGGSPGAVVQSGVFATQPANNGFGEPPLGPVVLGESQTATVTITIKGVNDPPAVGPTVIGDTTIFTGNPTRTVSLFAHFEDPDNTDTELTYTVTGNTNPTLVQTSAISSGDGILTLTTPCDLIGSADITVEAKDPDGLTITDTFNVNVVDNVPPQVITPGLVKVLAPDGQTSAVVTFTVTGLDKVDGTNVTINCTPASGSVFDWGSTTVNCTATDQSGQVGNGSFTVTVKLPGDVALESVSVGDAADGAGAVGDGTYNQIDGAHLTANGNLLVAAKVDTNPGLWSGDISGGLGLVGLASATTPPGASNPLAGFDRVAIGENGESAFRARLDGAPKGADAGHWFSSGGTLTEVAVLGGTVPGVPGATFFKLPIKGWALNNAGEYFYLGQMNKVGGVTEADNQGIFSNLGGLLIREGDLAPAIGGGATYTAFENQIGANGSGQVAFASALRLGGVANGIDNRAVFCGAPSSPAVVARRGDVAPGAGGSAEFDSFLDVGLNAAGECAFVSRLRDGGVTPGDNDGIWSDGGGGGLALVAREGDTAPDFGDPTSVFDSFSEVQITDNGAVVFRANLRNDSVPLSAREDGAIYIYRPGSGLTLVASEGGVARGTQSTYTNLRELSVHPGGELGFNAVLRRNVGGVTRRTEHGVWVLDFEPASAGPPEPILLVQAGDPMTIGGEEETVHRAFITGGEDGGTAGRSSGVACGNVVVVVNYDGNRSTTVFVMGVPDPVGP